MKEECNTPTISTDPNDLTVEFKLKSIIDTFSMTDEQRTTYCLKYGVHFNNIDEWKKAVLISLENVNTDLKPTLSTTSTFKQFTKQELVNFLSCEPFGSNTPDITLHAGSINYLFEHFYALRQIFSNVLGQEEIDYLSIALINKNNQMFFLSSCPSIEQHMIKHNLLRYDGSLTTDFINQNEPKLWRELYHPDYSSLMHLRKHQDLN